MSSPKADFQERKTRILAAMSRTEYETAAELGHRLGYPYADTRSALDSLKRAGRVRSRRGTANNTMEFRKAAY